jgi:putative ABC transport system permease protein
VNWGVYGAVRMVARSEFRRQRWALVALAAVVALGLGASLGGFAAAYRTDHAYPEYVRDADVTDLVVNPLLATQEFADGMRDIPHVRGMWTQDLLYAGVGEWHPMTAEEVILDDQAGEGIGSVDGRYEQADRLMIDEGRAPTGQREVFVTESFRPRLDERMGHRVEVGEQIPVVFLYPGDLTTDTGRPFDLDKIIEPIGTERLRVTGFGRLPDEVFDDELFPRQRFVVSADVTRKYSCVGTLAGATPEQIADSLHPRDCAGSYRYWALDIDEPDNVAAVARAVTDLTDELNAGLPAALQAEDATLRYFPILTTQSDLDARVAHSVQPIVVALILFGLLAGVASLVLAVLAGARILRSSRATDETVQWLGMSRSERALAIALPTGVVVAVGCIAAVLVGYVGSRAGPLGEVRRVTSRTGSSLPAAVLIPVVVAFVAAFALALVLLAIWTVRAAERHVTSRFSGPNFRGANPALADGVRNALSTRRGGALLTGSCCVVVATLVGAGMFGANLSMLVDRPEHYGWPWDVGVMTGGGYGGTNLEQVAADLGHREDVTAYDLLGFTGGNIEGENVAVTVASSDAPPVDLPVVSGRAPSAPGEAAIGTITAARLGLDVGDVTELEIREGPTPLKIVGTTVLPAVGQVFADRSGLGVGAFVIEPPEVLNGEFVTFIGLHLAPGTDARRVVEELRPKVVAWDTTGDVPEAYAAPVRPAEIVNAEDMRRGPLILAGVLAIALLAALALSIAGTVNARRRDFAIYRAMGFTRGQAASSVRWQSLTTVAVGIVIGIPAGILVGRWTWRRFAGDLGVGLGVTTPLLLLAAVALVAVVAALLAAARPARLASRLRPAEILHTQ